MDKKTVSKIALAISDAYIEYVKKGTIQEIVNLTVQSPYLYLCEELPPETLKVVLSHGHSASHAIFVNEKIFTKVHDGMTTIFKESLECNSETEAFKHFCDSMIFAFFCLMNDQWVENVLKMY